MQDKIIINVDKNFIFNIGGCICIYSLNGLSNVKVMNIKNFWNQKDLYIYYNFAIRKCPMFSTSKNEKDFILKPTLDELRKKSKNELKSIKNFYIKNKYWKLTFIDNIDLSEKIFIDDLIKIKEHIIETEHPKITNLKPNIETRFFKGELNEEQKQKLKENLRSDNYTYELYCIEVLSYHINY